jgi:hypothetical protein
MVCGSRFRACAAKRMQQQDAHRACALATDETCGFVYDRKSSLHTCLQSCTLAACTLVAVHSINGGAAASGLLHRLLRTSHSVPCRPTAQEQALHGIGLICVISRRWSALWGPQSLSLQPSSVVARDSPLLKPCDIPPVLSCIYEVATIQAICNTACLPPAWCVSRDRRVACFAPFFDSFD